MVILLVQGLPTYDQDRHDANIEESVSSANGSVSNCEVNDEPERV